MGKAHGPQKACSWLARHIFATRLAGRNQSGLKSSGDLTRTWLSCPCWVAQTAAGCGVAPSIKTAS